MINHTSIISHETVCISRVIAVLNDLVEKVAGILNAYELASTKETDARKQPPLQALYGLKNALTSFWCHLAECMQNIECKPFYADHDVWLKLIVMPVDGTRYHSHILCYFDDIYHDADVSCIGKIGVFLWSLVMMTLISI